MRFLSLEYRTGPHYNRGDWVRHHDRNDGVGVVDAGGRFIAADSSCKCGECLQLVLQAAPDMMEVDQEPPMGLPQRGEDDAARVRAMADSRLALASSSVCWATSIAPRKRMSEARAGYEQSLRLARQEPARSFLERRLEELKCKADGRAG